MKKTDPTFMASSTLTGSDRSMVLFHGRKRSAFSIVWQQGSHLQFSHFVTNLGTRKSQAAETGRLYLSNPRIDQYRLWCSLSQMDLSAASWKALYRDNLAIHLNSTGNRTNTFGRVGKILRHHPCPIQIWHPHGHADDIISFHSQELAWN